MERNRHSTGWALFGVATIVAMTAGAMAGHRQSIEREMQARARIEQQVVDSCAGVPHEADRRVCEEHVRANIGVVVARAD